MLRLGSPVVWIIQPGFIFWPLERRDFQVGQLRPQGRDHKTQLDNPKADEAGEERLKGKSTKSSGHLVKTISNKEVLFSKQCCRCQLPQFLNGVVRVCDVPVQVIAMFSNAFFAPKSGLLHLLFSVSFPWEAWVVSWVCVEHLGKSFKWQICSFLV